MDILSLVLIAAIIFAAGFMQSAVGFGYALFATPLLVNLGLDLPHVIALVATCSMVQTAIGAGRLRASIPWRLALFAVSVRLLGIGVGMVLLAKLVQWNPEHVKLAVGMVLCFLVLLQSLWRPQYSAPPHWSRAAASFLGSGILQGICGMGGPPVVLWSLSQNWASSKIRGFLFTVFGASVPIQLALLWFAFGTGVLWSVAVALAFLPAVFLGALLGMPLGNKLSTAVLRPLAHLILLAIGMSAMAPALIAHLR